MLTSLPPFYDEDVTVMYKKILEDPLVFPSDMDSVTKDLISKLLNRNPEERLGYNGVHEIKNHPFFKDIDWVKLNNKGYIPPYKPQVKNNMDISNISSEFTDERPMDSVVDDFLSESVQKQFGGWTYVGSYDAANNA
jgi:serum/glucocorticoid-regulated kinase 2